ncbi:PH domain-containing protein [Nocardia transvalensis]|uniref:PH domain-containing protein n=1 Tax=Nocardia transvalensis TaxID=37333 RepID=UPI0018954A01|nr:PH domain-containing protein [Nocardia transvalensis]MBF6330969.1 PH domain-containing protein [Nocardia transvalensis]
MPPVVRIWKRGPQPTTQPEWDLEIRPRRSVRTARIVAAVIAILFTIAGIATPHSATGVNIRVADQIALVCFGWLLAAAVLLLTRPRVRVGPRGVSVRNILGDNDFAWRDIRGVSIPDKKAWARLELAGDEYAPMLAIRVNDGDHAAHAMERFRELGAKYTATQGD